ncbi:hypothetical protein TBLA_0B04400 [Henningerozyma blattae CBS 6284]|uniref:Aminoacyl-transfer RNA synthetases class-II family profile domain-containing protein n=1 Tax=Henningerozyma blattae (strain ATCC 34711 / CBS 6284 / DSM 70876 / NBRC 10599 / NRRL Y-10934 / UCD 77-7) TaxID=1071380 RepID=I2GYS5_HENB6|nr:hypothetical protein TBLA_0B04400 [Tetrapisispora blattae CBS 6284]CCH59277.1 hypothetical protein TBLA_0B04400 [Tetrapisispora blattae CBS 6284]
MKNKLSTVFVRCVHTPSYEQIANKFRFLPREKTTTISQLDNYKVGEQVILNGWLLNKTKQLNKNLQFNKIRDINGDEIQIVDTLNCLKNRKMEDVIQITGKIQLKQKGKISASSIEKEIKLDKLQVLNASNEIPIQLSNVVEYPNEYRFLELRKRIQSRNYLWKRYEMIKFIRTELDLKNFIEIETPYLFKSTPEGASEFLVPTRQFNKSNNKVKMYALPQSPQQYKQLLMSSGINRYFQIAKCFRDEDLRKDRQPEFTQLDIENSFINDPNDIIQLIDDLIIKIWTRFSYKKKLKLLTWNDELKQFENLLESSLNSLYKMKYNYAMETYGIDKPDLRAPNLKIINLKNILLDLPPNKQNKQFPDIEIIVLRNAFDNKEVEESYNTRWSQILENPSNYNYRKPIVVAIQNETDKINWYKHCSDIFDISSDETNASHILNKSLKLNIGDIICCSTRQPNGKIFENPTPLGRLRQLVLESDIGSKLYFETPNDVSEWVIDFPLFNPVEKESTEKLDYPIYEENQLTSTHHPFTMANIDDISDKLLNAQNKIDKILETRGMHYDLVINGMEIGGGSIRIHDSELQEYIFKEILKVNNYEAKFGHLLKAFQMGTPPHGGIALGIDRLSTIICGVKSIRDVIAFPKNSIGSDLMVGSPSEVPDDTLARYKLQSQKE